MAHGAGPFGYDETGRGSHDSFYTQDGVPVVQLETSDRIIAFSKLIAPNVQERGRFLNIQSMHEQRENPNLGRTVLGILENLCGTDIDTALVCDTVVLTHYVLNGAGQANATDLGLFQPSPDNLADFRTALVTEFGSRAERYLPFLDGVRNQLQALSSLYLGQREGSQNSPVLVDRNNMAIASLPVIGQEPERARLALADRLANYTAAPQGTYSTDPVHGMRGNYQKPGQLPGDLNLDHFEH